MQAMRRRIVESILSGKINLEIEWINLLKKTYEILTDSNTSSFQRSMLSTSAEKFLLNVKDEILGLKVKQYVEKISK